MTGAEDKYSDIINMPHHRSKKHKPMPLSDRAAQFAPFAALTGFYDLIDEKTGAADDPSSYLNLIKNGENPFENTEGA